MRYYDLATAMALKSTDRFRLGAVLVKKKRILSTGFNQMRKTHTKASRCSADVPWHIGIHAELHACLGVSPKDLIGSELWVARILRNGDRAMARPCKFCTRFLRSVGVVKAHFTTSPTGFDHIDL